MNISDSKNVIKITQSGSAATDDKDVKSVQSNKVDITISPYTWTIENSPDRRNANDGTTINCWGFDRDSNPCLLRIMDPPVFCYAILPEVVENRIIQWNEDLTRQLFDKIKWLLTDRDDGSSNAPISCTLVYRQKLYYYYGNRKFPMLLLRFKNLDDQRKCENLFKRPVFVKDLGAINCIMCENKIDIIRKFLTLRNMSYTQWLDTKAVVPSADEKINIVGPTFKEYQVSWLDVFPAPAKKVEGWQTRPKILAYDIECYSDKHKALPNALDAKHIAYMISCVIQTSGLPETRKRIGIIYGDCYNIPPDKLKNTTIIRTNSELEMIQAFAKVVREEDPTVCAGYNIYGFDNVYLDDRLKRLKNEWPLMGRTDKKTDLEGRDWESSGYGNNIIKIIGMDGRISIDLMISARRDMKLRNYRLETVAQHVLKKGKHDIKAVEMFIALEQLFNAIEEVNKYSTVGTPDVKKFIEQIKSLHDFDITEETLKNIISEYKVTVGTRKDTKNDTEGAEGAKDDKSEIRNLCKGKTPEDAIPIPFNVLNNPTLLQALLQLHKAKKRMSDIMEYCIRDSELIIELMDKLNTWIGLLQMSDVVGVTIMDILTRGQQARVLSLIYNLSAKKGIVMDYVPTEGKSFKGGAVQKPRTGLSKNVIVLDFKSLYPSIIKQYNICYTTRVPPEMDQYVKDEDCNIIEFEIDNEDFEEPEDDDVPDLNVPVVKDSKESEDLQGEEPDDQQDQETTEGKSRGQPPKIKKRFRYVKERIRRGILPELVANLVDERNAVRKTMKGMKDLLMLAVAEGRQLALKMTANSVFGFTGVGGKSAKLPFLEGAMSITAWGRQLIGQVQSYIKDKYRGEIVYGDSVPGDTPVLLKMPDGGIIFAPIEKIGSYKLSDGVSKDTEAKLRESSFGATADKTCVIGGNVDKDQKDVKSDKPKLMLMIDGNGPKEHCDMSKSGICVWSDKGWTPIKYVMRHKTKKRIYRILTHTGCVDVTEDHSLLLADGKLAKPNEVKIGTQLMHNPLPIVSHDYKFPEDLAWVYGLFYAEGTCGTYFYEATDQRKEQTKSSWAISNQDHKLLNKAAEILHKYEPDYKFVIDPCIGVCPSAGEAGTKLRLVLPEWEVNTDKLSPRGRNHKKLVDKYQELFYYCNSKKVPEIIIMSPNSVKQAFFDGYRASLGGAPLGYAGDGSKCEPSLRFDNKDKIGTAGLNYITHCLGYKNSLQIHTDKDPEAKLQGGSQGANSGEPCYRTNITKKSQRKDPTAIKKIWDLGYTTDYVYDFETENHHFSAGIGNIVVHNTDSVMVDLQIKDPDEADRMGKQLAAEISGTPAENGKPAIPGLFGDHLGMEFEKVFFILFCLTPKRYAGVLYDAKKRRAMFERFEIYLRGLDLAKRDKCDFHYFLYWDTLMGVLKEEPFIEPFTRFVKYVEDMIHEKIPAKDFAITRKLGSNYKPGSKFFMKVFGDNLNKWGIPATPGDRLEYIITRYLDEPFIKTSKDPKMMLGDRMRTPEQVAEELVLPFLPLGVDKPTEEIEGKFRTYEVNCLYYLEKQFMNPIQQLFVIGYPNDIKYLDGMGFVYRPSSRHRDIPISKFIKILVRMIERGVDINYLPSRLREAFNKRKMINASAGGSDIKNDGKSTASTK